MGTPVYSGSLGNAGDKPGLTSQLKWGGLVGLNPSPLGSERSRERVRTELNVLREAQGLVSLMLWHLLLSSLPPLPLRWFLHHPQPGLLSGAQSLFRLEQDAGA